MPETLQARCPSCRAAFQVPAELAGKKIRCKNCQTVFTVAAGGPAKPATAKPVRPAKPVPAKPVAAEPPKPKNPFDEPEDTGPMQYQVIKEADDSIPRCPHCAKELDPPDTLICLNCGFDLLERRRHESKETYENTAGDWIMHHLPAVACLLVIGALMTVCIICYLNMADWFEGSFLEQEETDPNTGKKKFYLPPGFCNVWIVVPSLFIMWKCGKFAFKRFVFQWKPPDKIVKK